ncbi:hypothetical protein [Cellulomonas sp. HZM]|uniref:hypothetical protein n=1 Tax=Cellulomonas sp. HZM TaxID=1454010 RepID=UPI0004931052|nr:hypothetical protein [Cellulomonas sp. HZM]
MTSDAEAVRALVDAQLAAPDTWKDPSGYRGSLALCVLDSVFSLRATYPATARVLKRFRAARKAAGSDPDVDNLADLVAAIDEVGGPERAAGPALFSNGSYAPGTVRKGRRGVLKAEAVYDGATGLLAVGISTIEDLRANTPGAEAAWLAVRGLGWVSWDYLRMLTGETGVKADTMLQRFVATALNVPKVTGERAKGAVTEAAELMTVDARVLDHAIWLYQREQP